MTLPRLAALAFLVAGGIAGLSIPARRLADASSYVLMADSIWHDRDLRYTGEDLARARQLRFDDLPAGLFLTRRDGTYFYAKPSVYPLVAAPFFGLLGVQGFFVLNGLLLAGLVLLGGDILSHRLGWKAGLGVSGLVVAFSVTPAYAYWIDPFLLYTVLAAAGVAAWRRGRPGLCAALLMLLAHGRAPYGALLAAPAYVYASRRHWSELTRFASVGLVVGGLLLLCTRLAIEQWSPYTGERYWYPSVPPYATPDGDGRGLPFSKTPLLTEWHAPALRDLAINAGSFVYGRFAGLLLYFPTFFACGLWALRADREKLAWLGAAAIACLLLQATLAHNPFGGSHALGNRLFVLLPVALTMVEVVAWLPWRLAGTALLLLLVVPVIKAPEHFSVSPGQRMLALPYRWFPLEWRQAPALLYPYRFPGLMALTANQYDWEPSLGGVWTIGGTRAEFVLLRPASAPATVGLSSFLPTARVSDGAMSRKIHFSPGRMETIALTARAAARNEIDRLREYAVYHLVVETPTGVTSPTGGDDPRPLGVLVRPLS